MSTKLPRPVRRALRRTVRRVRQVPSWLGVGIASAAIALGGGAALLSTGLHADASENAATSSRHVEEAEYNNAYYACLSQQAHSLIGPRSVVFLPHPSLDEWAIVIKVIGGWAHVTLDSHRATLALVLGHWSGRGTCDGDVLVAVVDHDGHTVFERGRSKGAS